MPPWRCSLPLEREKKRGLTSSSLRLSAFRRLAEELYETRSELELAKSMRSMVREKPKFNLQPPVRSSLRTIALRCNPGMALGGTLVLECAILDASATNRRTTEIYSLPQERAYATVSSDQKAAAAAAKGGKGVKGVKGGAACEGPECGDPKPLSEGVCKVLCPSLDKNGEGDGDDDE